MDGDSINADELIKRMSPPRWGGDEFQCNFQRGAEGAAIAVGFYEFEDFGVWSRVSKPFLILDQALSGTFVLTVEARAFGNNIGQYLTITIGDCTRPLVLDEIPKTIGLLFDVREASHVVRFDGVIARSDPANDDPRSLGIGLTALKFRRLEQQGGLARAEQLSVNLKSGTQDEILFGFHPAESWGVWTEHDEAWIVVPPLQPGLVEVEMEYRSHGANEGKVVKVDCGGSMVDLPTGDRWEHQTFELRPHNESQVIHLAGWQSTPVEHSGDPRCLGIGISHLSLRQVDISQSRHSVSWASAIPRPTVPPSKTSPVKVRVPNKTFVVAIDGQANDESNSDVISAFVYAHRHDPDALLFVVSPELTITNVFSDVLYLLSRVGSYSCRVIVLPRTKGQFIPEAVLDVSHVFVLAVTAQPSESDLARAFDRQMIVLSPDHLIPEALKEKESTVVIPVTLRPYRVPGERFGYRRNLVQVVEWDDLVRGMASAGDLAGSCET